MTPAFGFSRYFSRQDALLHDCQEDASCPSVFFARMHPSWLPERRIETRGHDKKAPKWNISTRSQASRVPPPSQESRDGRRADVVEFGDLLSCVPLVEGKDNALPDFHGYWFGHGPSSKREKMRPKDTKTDPANQLLAKTL